MSELNEEPAFGDDEEPEIWDEFQWEEFMKEADKRTEKYSRLFEKYLDHPDRDNIIAKEMGWDHLLDESKESEDANLWDEILMNDFFEEGRDGNALRAMNPQTSTVLKIFQCIS